MPTSRDRWTAYQTFEQSQTSSEQKKVAFFFCRFFLAWQLELPRTDFALLLLLELLDGTKAALAMEHYRTHFIAASYDSLEENKMEASSKILPHFFHGWNQA